MNKNHICVVAFLLLSIERKKERTKLLHLRKNIQQQKTKKKNAKKYLDLFHMMPDIYSADTDYPQRE
jgi:transposase